MQTNSRFFDDLSKLATGAMGAAAGLRTEIETMMKERMQRLLADMDLVTREEFEAVRAMAVKARTEQEALLARVMALEEALLTSNRAEPPPVQPGAEGLPG